MITTLLLACAFAFDPRFYFQHPEGLLESRRNLGSSSKEGDKQASPSKAPDASQEASQTTEPSADTWEFTSRIIRARGYDSKKDRYYGKQPERVVFVLDSLQEVDILQDGYPTEGKEYHILSIKDWDMILTLVGVKEFDAQRFVSAAVDYVKNWNSENPPSKHIKAVTASNCFPSFIAAAINLNLRQDPKSPSKRYFKGPSFHSSLIMDNKYYMRSLLKGQYATNLKINQDEFATGEYDGNFIVKRGSAQFKLNQTGDQWNSIKDDPKHAMRTGHPDIFRTNEDLQTNCECDNDPDSPSCKRKAFILKHLQMETGLFENFKSAMKLGDSPSVCQIRLSGVEKVFNFTNKTHENQIEVIIYGNQTWEIADTGDLIHADPEENLSKNALLIFKTNSNQIPVKCDGRCDIDNEKGVAEFVNSLMKEMKAWGANNTAMDVEIFRTTDKAGVTTQVDLIEINARYSWMGWEQREPLSESGNPMKCLGQNGKMVKAQPWPIETHLDAKVPKGSKCIMRNLNNRAQLALGQRPGRIPARDFPEETILATFITLKKSAWEKLSENWEPVDIFDIENKDYVMKWTTPRRGKIAVHFFEQIGLMPPPGNEVKKEMFDNEFKGSSFLRLNYYMLSVENDTKFVQQVNDKINRDFNGTSEKVLKNDKKVYFHAKIPEKPVRIARYFH
jgi:hypothetical protein